MVSVSLAQSPASLSPGAAYVYIVYHISDFGRANSGGTSRLSQCHTHDIERALLDELIGTGVS